MNIKFKITVFIIVFAFLFGIINFAVNPVNFTALALSNAHVELSDYRPNIGNVTYTITFRTDPEKKLTGGDSVILQFMKKVGNSFDSFNTQTVVQPSSTSYIKINGESCSGIYTTPQSGYVRLTVPDSGTFANGVGNITVTILPQSGFMNPSPGTYAIRVSTSKETTPILTNSYVIGNPKLSDLTVNVSPALVNALADYEISFKTSNFGSLDAGSDRIRITFPDGTQLPSEIPQNTISVTANNVTKKVASAIVPTTNNEVLFTVPSGLNIGANDVVHISLPEACGIKNPSDSGEYTLTVDTEESDGTYIDSPTESPKYKISASAITDLSVSVVPNEVNASPDIKISFKTSSVGALTAHSGTISVKFPEDTPNFYVPQMMSKSSVLVNGVSAYKVEVSGYLVNVIVPENISASSLVTLEFKSTSGIKTPDSPGNYTLQVWTSADPEAVETPEISISTSKISRPSVVVTPSIVNMNASYIITFTTGSSGALQAGDNIYITFPQGTYVPASIPQTTVQVNGASARSVTVNQSAREVAISVPTIIGSGSTIAVILGKGAGIKNPSSPGSYTLKVHTDSETADVTSAPYSINKGVTTSLTVNPPTPDGKNGYYKTVPEITINADNPSHLSYKIYYKWDDGDFSLYTSGEKLKPSQGVHTLYYYSVDQFQHKEQVHKQVFKVDSVKPVLEILSPKDNITVNSPNITIYGKSEPGVSLKVQVNGSVQSINVNSDGKFQYSYIFSSNGFYTFNFTAEDEAGNVSLKVLTIQFISQKRIMLKVDSKTAYVNDQKVMLDAAPVIYKNRVMVPIRFISQSLGAQVEWDPIFKIVTITMPNGKRVRLQVGNSVAAVGVMNASGKYAEKPVKLDAPPIIVKNRTFVPIRFIAEAFGAEVDWDPEFRVVRIIYPKPKP